MSSYSDYAPPTYRHAALFFLVVLVPYGAAQPNPSGPEDPYQYARFSPSMAIIVVVLIAALFFMAFFSIYIRHCNDGTGSVRPVAGLRGGRASAEARGLDASVIEKFPTFAYSAVKSLKIGKEELECAVCLCEFDDDETLRLLPKCDHVFHPHCIDAWLASHTTCPVCRADLAPDNSADTPADVDALPESPDDQRVEVQAVDPAPVSFNRNATLGSRSGRARKFPRSHSTGHSLVQPGEDTERFTLRLPVEARKQIMANRALNRATSMVVLPRGGKSCRRLESDRWVFTMAPPFFVRESSAKWPKMGDQEASDSPKPTSFFIRAFSKRVAKQAAREEGASTSQKPHSPV